MAQRFHPTLLLITAHLGWVAATGCTKDPPPEPLPHEFVERKASEPKESPSTASPPKTAGRSRHKVAARPVASVTPSPDDPLKGQWTLVDATQNLPGQGVLLADIEVTFPTKGSDVREGKSPKLTCQLWEDKAPLTVANFVGLARGLRPWKTPENVWAKRPAYDGTIFHRIIRGFMIQGGDAQGTGTGEPGYVIPDEIWEDAHHDRPGLLCMANRGPNTNGAQFFITDAAAPHLDNGYTIFGECAPLDLVHRIAATEVKGEHPTTPPRIKKITIRRGANPSASASASTPAP